MNQALLHELARRAARGGRRGDGALRRAARRGSGLLRRRGPRRADLLRPADPGVLRPFRNVFLDCANLCEAMPKPVVCQIHRACVGGALEVALGCDLRVASSDSQLGLPEVRFGIIPDVGGSSRLPAVVGLGRAKELIMTARTIDAAEAHAIGLVNRRRGEPSSSRTRRGARRGAARQLARRGRPCQARDGRLGASRAREHAGAGGRGAGVLRRGAARGDARSATGGVGRRELSGRWPGRGLGWPPASSAEPGSGPRLAPVHGAGDERVTPEGAPQQLLDARAQASSAGRSMPVSIPISCSIETRSSVAILPVAPAGTGQPPSSPKLDSKLSIPASSAASTLASPCPRVLWKCAVSSTAAAALAAPRPSLHCANSSRTWRGLAIPVVSPKPISCAPASRRRVAISKTRAGGTWPS